MLLPPHFPVNRNKDNYKGEERKETKIREGSMSGLVERALCCLGRGFDLACDFKAKYSKGEERLVVMNEKERQELVVPGFGVFPGVSGDVKCDKGERIRFQPDVLEFDKMSELFNQRCSLYGRIPSGHFNAMFGFGSSTWAQDAAETKSLAMDGFFVSLFSLRIDRRPLVLSDHIISSVPSTWDPVALARFIENFGTHIIVGLSVGGQDVVYVRQDQSSNLSTSEIKQHLDKLGDQLFTGTCTLPPLHWKLKELKNKAPGAFNVFDPTVAPLGNFTAVLCKDGLTVICSKRGGDTSVSSHWEWLPTVSTAPDIIDFAFVPITSVLKGVPGAGFLSHAINLYLRYKPPITDLRYFLDFQYHKAWAPMLNDHPLGPSSNRPIPAPSLHFNLMGPKLYVNTNQVTVGHYPVTGMRLHLEGKKNNRYVAQPSIKSLLINHYNQKPLLMCSLAVHVEHLSNCPAFIRGFPADKAPLWLGSDALTTEEGYYEPVTRRRFSHACTAPVEHEPHSGLAFIVTGAQLLVKDHGSTSVLHLKLQFSEVTSCVISQSKWERGYSGVSQKSSGFLSAISGMSSGKLDRETQQPQEKVVIMDSGVFHMGPPAPVQEQKLLRFVDASQICMGPQDSPGFWLVTGAKLDLEKGKIALHVKFSLLTDILTQDLKSV